MLVQKIAYKVTINRKNQSANQLNVPLQKEFIDSQINLNSKTTTFSGRKWLAPPQNKLHGLFEKIQSRKNPAYKMHCENLINYIKENKNLDINDTENYFGMNILMRAAYKGYSELIQPLVDLGANVNSRSLEDMWPPLFYGIISGDLQTVKRLVACGADVFAKDKNNRNVFSIITELATQESDKIKSKTIKDYLLDVMSQIGFFFFR